MTIKLIIACCLFFFGFNQLANCQSKNSSPSPVSTGVTSVKPLDLGTTIVSPVNLTVAVTPVVELNPIPKEEKPQRRKKK